MKSTWMEQFFTKFAFIHLETDLQQHGSLPLAQAETFYAVFSVVFYLRSKTCPRLN